MAEWIKYNQGLHRDTVVMAQARSLKMDARIIAHAWLELWLWARERTSTGLVRHATAHDIDEVVNIPDFSKHAGRWLVVDERGVMFPAWNKHNSNGARQRDQANRRKARFRDGNGTRHRSQSVDQSRAEQSRADKSKAEAKQCLAPPVLLEGERLRSALLGAGVPESEVWGLMTHERATPANLTHAAARMHEMKRQGKVIKFPTKMAMAIAWDEPGLKHRTADAKAKASNQFAEARRKENAA